MARTVKATGVGANTAWVEAVEEGGSGTSMFIKEFVTATDLTPGFNGATAPTCNTRTWNGHSVLSWNRASGATDLTPTILDPAVWPNTYIGTTGTGAIAALIANYSGSEGYHIAGAKDGTDGIYLSLQVGTDKPALYNRDGTILVLAPSAVSAGAYVLIYAQWDYTDISNNSAKLWVGTPGTTTFTATPDASNTNGSPNTMYSPASGSVKWSGFNNGGAEAVMSWAGNQLVVGSDVSLLQALLDNPYGAVFDTASTAKASSYYSMMRRG